MKKRQIIIVVSAVVIIAAGVLGREYLSSLKKDPPKRSTPKAKQFVKTDLVQYATKGTQIQASGRVKAAQKVILTPEVQGKLMRGAIRFKEGTDFKKGQLLFKIDDTEARLNLNAEKSSFLTQIANILPDIKIDYPEAYPQWKKYFDEIEIEGQLKPLPEIEQPQLKTFLAVQNVLNRYYAIKSAEARLEKYNFYAPFDGSFSSVNYETGANVSPGAQIAEIIESQDLEIEVPLSYEQIQWVEKGKKAEVTDYKDNTYTAEINRISSFLDPSTQSVKIYLKINNPGHFYEGMYMDVILEGPNIEEVYEIPRQALFDKNQVYLLQKDSSLQKQNVEVIKLNPSTAYIRGLKAKSKVVTEALVSASEEVKYLPAGDNSDKQKRKS